MREQGRQTRTIPFTEREQQILKMVVERQTYGAAAKALQMPESTVRSTLFRIRVRYENAKAFVEECESLQRQLPRKKRYITG